ncbi:hypothetical protein, partial [Rhizobium rhizogenes]|uniref:hypothetical protein n=1 Tax=Rhizobium rhizogenes TaxID=359 RepID=UPI001AEF3393
DLFVCETIALHSLVLSMGQSLLQNGLFQRGKVTGTGPFWRYDCRGWRTTKPLTRYSTIEGAIASGFVTTGPSQPATIAGANQFESGCYSATRKDVQWQEFS